MDVNLSAAELVVLAEHLSLDSQFAVGERTDAEVTLMKSEGWRSLLVRGFTHFEDDSALISAPLAQVASDVIAPLGLLTFTCVAGEDSRISTVLIGREGLLSATPITEDVASYSSTDVERVVAAIVAADDLPADATALYRVEVLNGGTRQSEGFVTWAKSADGSLVADSGEGVTEIDAESVAESIRKLMTLSDQTG